MKFICIIYILKIKYTRVYSYEEIIPISNNRLNRNSSNHGSTDDNPLIDKDKKKDESRILEDVLKSQSKYDLVKKLPKNPIAYQSVGDVSPNGSLFQTRRVPWDEPSHCLLEKGLETTFFSHLHPELDRGFTTYEAMRIMGLPKNYELVGTLDEKLGMIRKQDAAPLVNATSANWMDRLDTQIPSNYLTKNVFDFAIKRVQYHSCHPS